MIEDQHVIVPVLPSESLLPNGCQMDSNVIQTKHCYHNPSTEGKAVTELETPFEIEIVSPSDLLNVKSRRQGHSRWFARSWLRPFLWSLFEKPASSTWYIVANGRPLSLCTEHIKVHRFCKGYFDDRCRSPTTHCSVVRVEPRGKIKGIEGQSELLLAQFLESL